jgi:hypothetical protein
MELLERFKEWKFSTSVLAGIAAAVGGVFFPPAAALLTPYVLSLAETYLFSLAGSWAATLALGTVLTGVFAGISLGFGTILAGLSFVYDGCCGSDHDEPFEEPRSFSPPTSQTRAFEPATGAAAASAAHEAASSRSAVYDPVLGRVTTQAAAAAAPVPDASPATLVR